MLFDRKETTGENMIKFALFYNRTTKEVQVVFRHGDREVWYTPTQASIGRLTCLVADGVKRGRYETLPLYGAVGYRVREK